MTAQFGNCNPNLRLILLNNVHDPLTGRSRGIYDQTEESCVRGQTVYRYFPSKEALFETALRDLVQRNVQVLTWENDPRTIKVTSRADFEESMKALAERIVNTLMNPTFRGLVKMIIADIGRSPQLGRLFRQTVPETVLGGIAAVLLRAQAAGVAAVPDPEIAVRLLIGPLLTYVLTDGLLSDGPPQPPDRERLAILVDQYLRSMPPHPGRST